MGKIFAKNGSYLREERKNGSQSLINNWISLM